MALVVRAWIALQDLHVKLAAVEHRARPVNPHDRKTPIVVGQIALPKFLASEIKGREITRREQDENPLPIGHWRRRRHIVAALLAVPSGYHPFPAHLAGLSIQAEQEQILLLIRTGGENAIFPNHRRSAAIARHRSNPDHVFRLAPLGRQTLLRRRAIEIRPAPLRPVLSTSGQYDQERQGKGNKQSSHKVTFGFLRPGLPLRLRYLSFASPASTCPISSMENRSVSSLSGPGSSSWPSSGATMTNTHTGTPSALSFLMKLRRASSHATSTQMQPLTTSRWLSTKCSSERNGWSAQARTDARISSI